MHPDIPEKLLLPQVALPVQRQKEQRDIDIGKLPAEILTEFGKRDLGVRVGICKTLLDDLPCRVLVPFLVGDADNIVGFDQVIVISGGKPAAPPLLFFEVLELMISSKRVTGLFRRLFRSSRR